LVPSDSYKYDFDHHLILWMLFYLLDYFRGRQLFTLVTDYHFISGINYIVINLLLTNRNRASRKSIVVKRVLDLKTA
jgi:hypothetical protein